MLTGCQKKCQPPAVNAFKNLSETTWRAVETSNPKVQITRFDFIELKFERDFTGSVIKVVANQEFAEQPIEVFTWAVPENTQGSGPLRIQYSTPGTDGSDGNAAAPPQVVSTEDYYFSLGRELNLSETKTGYSWRFVPMTGIVDPDTNCTF
jgi:hypothetical protein